ncbi:MAG: 4'-phosphopantetheinyl transferase family protein [Bacteroidia bacterium]
MTKIPTDATVLPVADWSRTVGRGGLLRMASLSAPEFENLPDPDSWLSQPLLKEYLQLKHEGRRREWIITRWMLLQQLRSVPMGASKGAALHVHLERGVNGQPVWPIAPNWGVSISHCPGYAAVLIAPGQVGVDVERCRPQVHRLADRYLQDSEQGVLGTATEALTLGWAAKEALFKWMGGGGIAFKEAFCIESIQTEEHIMRVRVQRNSGAEPVVAMVHYELQPALERVCAWVVDGS